MQKFLDFVMFYLAIGAGMFAAAQIPAPQINLTGNIGCQGFPCVNTGTLIMASDANRTVTSQETSGMSIKVTSSVSLTATRNLIFPAGKFPVDVENATTGGQSIQVIGASGAGVTIANGQTVRVWNDGTNFVPVGASGSGSGTVTHTTGSLTATHVMTGNGGADAKVDSGCTTDGAGNQTCVSQTTTGDGSHPSEMILGANGIAPVANAGAATIAAPATVTTANTVVLPTAPCTGYLQAVTDTSGVMPITCGTPGGSFTAAGDLSGSSSSQTVVGVEGATIPASATVLGTNSSRQLINASSGISQSLVTGNGERFGGDSICSGTGASVINTNGFAYLLRPIIGGFWNIDACRPADQLIDTTGWYFNTYIAPTNDGRYPLTIIEDGTNDVTQYNTSANLQTSWQGMYAADVYNAGIAYSVKSYPSVSLAGWTASSGWANDTTQTSIQPDYVSSTNGSTLTYTATCSASCVGFLSYPIWNANGGTFTVSLDGTPLTVPYGGGGTTFYAAGFNGATITAASSSASAFSKGGLRIVMASGSHTITVTVTSATSGSNKVGASWFALVPPQSNANPNVEAISLQHQNNSNDTLSGTYSGYISAIITQASTDGLNAYFANVRDALLNTAVPVNLRVAVAGTSYAAPQWVSGGLNTVNYYGGAPLTLVGSSPTQGQYAFSAGTYGLSAADANTPLTFNYNLNCGSTESAMFAACYSDTLHPHDPGHAVYASVIASSLPSRLVTGNNVPQVTVPLANYLGNPAFPSQMMSPNMQNIVSPLYGFSPGIRWDNTYDYVWFTAFTSTGGTTDIGPWGPNAFSVAGYDSVTQPASESQLTFFLTEGAFNNGGILKSNNFYNIFDGPLTVSADINPNCNNCGAATFGTSTYFYGTVPVVSITNNNNQGLASLRWIPNGSGSQSWEMGSGGNAVYSTGANCTTATNLWYMANFTTGSCVVTETETAAGLHAFTSIADAALTSGNCVQASTGGLLTTTGSPCGGGGMVYPGAGIPNSTGSAWGTSYAASGAGAGLVTGPTSSVNGDVVTYTGTSGQTQDSGVLITSIQLIGLETVTFSATPTFNTSTQTSRIILTGNITSFTLGSASPGQTKNLCFKQGSGSYTVTPPSNVHGFFTIGTTNGDWNCQSYNYDSSDSFWLAMGTGVINE